MNRRAGVDSDHAQQTSLRSVEPTKDDQPDRAGLTLGDLLYRDRTKTRIPESEWIALVRSIGTGDQQALHVLYEHTYRLVFTLAMRITNNRETAEEVTVDVFHQIWRKAPDYDPANGPVIGWIMNQARSRSIDRLRFDQRKKRVNAYGDSLPPENITPDPQRTYYVQEQCRLLREALDTLTPLERQAIEAAFFSEATYQEVAARLNQPLGTIKTRIRSGLNKLRLQLDRKLKGA